MFMNGNIRIGTVFGIPFFVNPSWFLVLGLVTLTYGNGLASAFPWLLPGVPLVLGLVTGLLVFASVLAHELGHSWVALRQGIPVRSITLFLFGGMASLEKESETPGDTFWVAIAGPAVSFALFLLLTLLGGVLSLPAPLMAILGVLAMVNFSLGAFNLIPGLPLDGGNILKALVWKVTGNRYQGVRFASWVGQAFGYLAIASGLIPLLLTGSFDNIWNILIGWFVVQNASQTGQFAKLQSRLTGLVAADAVSAENPVVAARSSLRDFVDLRTLSKGNWRKFLVTGEDSQLVGEISVDALASVPNDQWSAVQVGELMQPIDPLTLIGAESTLLQAIEQLELNRLSVLTVVRNGSLLGLLEKTAIINLIQQRKITSPV
jgi:Zn-dependent protease/CBS domain-containing protein